MTPGEAAGRYGILRLAYDRTLAAKIAVRGCAGRLEQGTLRDVERAARDAALELDSFISSNEARPALQEAMRAGLLAQ